MRNEVLGVRFATDSCISNEMQQVNGYYCEWYTIYKERVTLFLIDIVV